ncbi:MAG: FAD-dependent monooxygenase [Sphingopyxis sp.]|nr:FAD-dependent monooxygenase [Sphingopyxis sp.]
MMKLKTDILIAGAGPTGLALATSLQQAGVDHLLVDALDYAQNSSRAAVVHAHTLEMLETIGVTAELESQGMAVPDFVIRDRDQTLLKLSFDDLPSTFRHLLMVPQSTTEAVLQARLEELGGCVHRGIRVLDADQDDEGALASIMTPEGERIVTARYVVGADGMHSNIREAAGIGFEGEAYDASFILADVRMDWALGADEVSLFFSPQGLVVVAPLPGGAYRIVATLDDAPEKPTIADIQRLLDARGPTVRSLVTDIGWASRFRVHHRLADRYRAGPFMLMGDAAHVHSPAGGQGMNVGLVDAIVLGRALTRVVQGGESDRLLDAFAEIRRPAAEKVLALASRLTRAATLRSPVGRQVRNLLLRLINRVPPLKRRLALGLSGLDRRPFSELPRQSSVAPLSLPGKRALAPIPGKAY